MDTTVLTDFLHSGINPNLKFVGFQTSLRAQEVSIIMTLLDDFAKMANVESQNSQGEKGP